MSQKTSQRIHRVTALIALTAVAFGLFCHINHGGPFRDINPPSLEVGLLVTGVFITAELGAALLGFAMLGGYLGLRPTFRQDH